MKLRSKNLTTQGLEKSYLSNAYSAGAVSIEVRNNDRFIDEQKIMIGEMGHERTEIVTIGDTVTPAAAMTISALLYGHETDTPVYVLKYDKVRFHRSTTGVDGTYTQIAEVVMDVDNVDGETVYDDLAGLTSYFYKVSFYSTFDSTETDLSDPIPGSGYPRGTTGQLANEVFKEIGDTNQINMSVEEFLDLCNECGDDIISQSRRPYRFLKTSKLVNTIADNERISLPDNLAKFDRFKYTNVADQRVDNYRRITMNEMDYYNFDTTLASSNDLQFISIDESTNELVLYPKPSTSVTGAARVYYWKKFDELTSLADVLETPNSRIYKMFVMGRYYRKRAIKEPSYMAISDRFLSDYNTEVVKLQRSNKLDMGTPLNMKPDTGNSRGLRR